MARGSIRKRGDGWQIRVYAGMRDGEQQWTTRTVHGTRADAELTAARLVIEAAGGRGAAPAKGTVAELLEDYVDIVGTLKDWSPSTMAAVRGALDRYLIAGVGTEKASRLRPEHVTRFYAHLRRASRTGRPMSGAYIRRLHGILHAAFAWAVSEGRLPSNPIARAVLPPIDKPDVHAPRPEDVRRLLAGALEGDPLFAIWLRVGAATGMRRGEVCGLQWHDIDWTAGEIQVRRRVVIGTAGIVDVRAATKNRKQRTVPLDPVTLEILQRHHLAMKERALGFGRRLPKDAFLFSDDPTGLRPWRPDSAATGRFMKLRDRLGLEHIRLHDLRHAAATQLLVAGVDVGTAAAVLGHDPRTLLTVYAHPVDSARRRASDALAAVLEVG